VHTEGSTQTRRSLIQFNLGAIPSNSVVSCAVLLVNQAGIDNNHNIQVHRVITSWVEGNSINTGATWTNRDRGAGLPWTTQGGDYNAAVEASFVADTAGQRVVNLTSLAQFWVSNQLNFGLLLRSRRRRRAWVTVQFDGRQEPARHGWLFNICQPIY
jgi:hypothetical protein